MRKGGILAALLTSTRQSLLSATVLQPNRRWYFSELARHLGVQPSTIQRELSSFVAAGILQRTADASRVYYQADRSCPIFPELEGMLLKTVGLVDVLKEALKKLTKRLDLAFVYGSIASREEHSRSDVDLMVIGQIGLADVAAALRGVGRQIGREVNPTVYTTEEFQAAQARSHFLSTVLGSELLFVHGTPHDLERFAPAAAGKAAPDKPAGDPRPARRGRT